MLDFTLGQTLINIFYLSQSHQFCFVMWIINILLHVKLIDSKFFFLISCLDITDMIVLIVFIIVQFRNFTT